MYSTIFFIQQDFVVYNLWKRLLNKHKLKTKFHNQLKKWVEDFSGVSPNTHQKAIVLDNNTLSTLRLGLGPDGEPIFLFTNIQTNCYNVKLLSANTACPGTPACILIHSWICSTQSLEKIAKKAET